jgi:8-oxo-dGTP pyrophosphatase MutT (NUDIX family)
MPKTASAGGIVLNQKGEVALVKNGPDFWGFPKGHIDAGEDALAAAKREIAEETGLTELSIVRQYPAYERMGGRNMSELKSISMFLFTTDEDALAPRDPANPEARWVKAAEVGVMLTHPKDREFFENADLSILQR